MLHGIWLVVKLGRDILPTNISKKFNDYTIKTIISYWADKCSGCCSPHNYVPLYKNGYREITQLSCRVGLWFLGSALPLIAIYLYTKFYLNANLFARQGTWRTDVPTLHNYSELFRWYCDVFMSLNKPIITIFLTPKKTFPTVFMQNINLLFQMLARTDGHIWLYA